MENNVKSQIIKNTLDILYEELHIFNDLEKKELDNYFFSNIEYILSSIEKGERILSVLECNTGEIEKILSEENNNGI